ncbi:MAG: putative tRNA threonylcarbamoyladenosine biosynthesis protein Gcp [Candidatus Nomurabacteria bacterium GW2011_GWA1_46_11]|uniref:tRNA N6-adenosine threonylcarbamoyltransferase n=2 Tax=Parcubacteria group TaxID=1794811 RepID=A0A1G1YXH2_9BACT|nr:MAG: putative tRNA threonylcarbamoyladenosine biosynthesis protein Gcp [Parcubacteria group bacterium GW2011_GWA2_46_10]KKU22209.1 MAG: putative tRNA threonylcarbamoyladenosine biosynthesis protein Gcp [Candidatus Nomurabacteria bacterium GW2011_GWA1_46_11]OGY56496.1 MAG: tRNA (adenosine(37)-N6)-threonylcarbamoyltransferase complex transferase subunit TsaD [Candidatus Colwellbacteria bacterium GWA2_46_10]
MRILSIETSCDETAVALVEAKGGLKKPRFKVLKNEVASQIEVHRPYGGVEPGLARREHIKNLPAVCGSVVREKDWKDIDAVAVTVGPGLEIALWAGIDFARELAKKHKKPLLGANHLEGHLYSPLLSLKESEKNPKLPAIGLVVSGGHTILLALESIDRWKKIGETRDDAVGEAFDKVARLLGLPYPGGPEIQKVAEKGNAESIDFPRPMIHQRNFDFSFSGLKTSVLYYLRDKKLTSKLRADVAASFQRAAIETLVWKTIKAAWAHKAKSVFLAGGVAANKLLRETLSKRAKEEGLEFYMPEFKYSTDNAAMIAVAAYMNHEKGKKYRIKAQANLNL